MSNLSQTIQHHSGKLFVLIPIGLLASVITLAFWVGSVHGEAQSSLQRHDNQIADLRESVAVLVLELKQQDRDAYEFRVRIVERLGEHSSLLKQLVHNTRN